MLKDLSELMTRRFSDTARPYRIQNSEAELLKELKSAARKLVEKHDDLANRTIVAGGGLDGALIFLPLTFHSLPSSKS